VVRKYKSGKRKVRRKTQGKAHSDKAEERLSIRKADATGATDL